MSTFSTCTSSTRPSSPTDGDVLFETDTKNVILWDGTAWRGYASDGETLGANGYSLDLDGTDDRVELGDISALNSTSAFSITFWVKLSSSAPSPSSFYESGSDTLYNTIMVRQSTDLDFIIGKGGSAYAGTRATGTSIKDDQWHHLAAVYNGSTMTIYLDGSVPTQSNIGTAVPSSTVSTAGSNPHIGSKTDNSASMPGKMDDFSIFNAALTATEVTNIYNRRLYNPSKLIHQYRFENNYNDSKGSLNGTAQGNPTFDSSDKPY
jgi:hypothetical protein